MLRNSDKGKSPCRKSDIERLYDLLTAQFNSQSDEMRKIKSDNEALRMELHTVLAVQQLQLERQVAENSAFRIEFEAIRSEIYEYRQNKEGLQLNSAADSIKINEHEQLISNVMMENAALKSELQDLSRSISTLQQNQEELLLKLASKINKTAVRKPANIQSETKTVTVQVS